MMNHERVADNKFVKTEDQDHGYQGGYYIRTNGMSSDEEIAIMKEAVVEEICRQIREIAKARKDFFIIKQGKAFPGLNDKICTTVGAKYLLPTVKDNTPWI